MNHMMIFPRKLVNTVRVYLLYQSSEITVYSSLWVTYSYRINFRNPQWTQTVSCKDVMDCEDKRKLNPRETNSVFLFVESSGFPEESNFPKTGILHNVDRQKPTKKVRERTQERKKGLSQFEAPHQGRVASPTVTAAAWVLPSSHDRKPNPYKSKPFTKGVCFRMFENITVLTCMIRVLDWKHMTKINFSSYA